MFETLDSSDCSLRYTLSVGMPGLMYEYSKMSELNKKLMPRISFLSPISPFHHLSLSTFVRRRLLFNSIQSLSNWAVQACQFDKYEDKLGVHWVYYVCLSSNGQADIQLIPCVPFDAPRRRQTERMSTRERKPITGYIFKDNHITLSPRLITE